MNGVTHTYDLDGTKILSESWGTNKLIPLYDNEDSVCGILYNGTPFYFLKNLQGDIIAITDRDGTTVATYSYDAWGLCTVTSDTSGCNISNINPFRYRGYYFDTEIEMYYLQSRYYDPENGRFVNADECALIAALVEEALEQNLFQYAINSPIKNGDPNGYAEQQLYAIPDQLYQLMFTLSAAGASLLASLKTMLAMILNIVVVVVVIVAIISLVIVISQFTNKIYEDLQEKINAKLINEYRKFKNKICVYVLTRRSNPFQSIFYVGRTKNILARYSHHSNPSSKYYKGTFYMFVVYVCKNETESRIVEQGLLSACLVGKFTQIVLGQAPSNRIRSIARNKIKSVVGQIDEPKRLADIISLLGCRSENELLNLLGQ